MQTMLLANEEQRQYFMYKRKKHLIHNDILLGSSPNTVYYIKFSYTMYLIAFFMSFWQYTVCYANKLYGYQWVLLIKMMFDLYCILLFSKLPLLNRSIDCRRAFFNLYITYYLAVVVFYREDSVLYIGTQFTQVLLQILMINVPFALLYQLAYIAVLTITTFFQDYLFFRYRNIALFHSSMIAVLVLYNYAATLLNNLVSLGSDSVEYYKQISYLFSTLVRNSLPQKVYKQICDDYIPCTHVRQDDIIVCMQFLSTYESDEVFAAKCYMFTFLLDRLCEIVGMLKVYSGFADYIVITDKFIAYGGILQDITRKQLFNQAAIFCQFALEVSRVVDFYIKLLMTVGDINFYVNGFYKCFIWSNISGAGIEKARALLAQLDKGIYLDHTSILRYCSADDVSKAPKKVYTFRSQIDEMHIITSYIRKNQKPPKLFAPYQIKYAGYQYEIDFMELTIEAKELFSKVLEMMLIEKNKAPAPEEAVYQNYREIRMMLDNVDNVSIRYSSSVQYSCTSCDVSEQLSVKLGFEMSSDESDDISHDFSEFTYYNPKIIPKRISARRPSLETVEENENDSNLRAFLEKYRRYIDSLEIKQNTGQSLSFVPSESRIDQVYAQDSTGTRVLVLLRHLWRMLTFYCVLSDYAVLSSYNSFFYRSITCNYSFFFLVKIPYLIGIIFALLYLNARHDDEIFFFLGWKMPAKYIAHCLLWAMFFAVLSEAYLLWAIQKQKVIEHDVGQFDEKVFLCSSLYYYRTESAGSANVTLHNLFYRIVVSIYQFLLHGVGVSQLIIADHSTSSFDRKIAVFAIAFLMLYRQYIAICLGSPYFMSVYDMSHTFLLTFLMDSFYIAMVAFYDKYYALLVLLIKYVHLFHNHFLMKYFYRLALVNQSILEKSEKYARKLYCFYLPITIYTILQNYMQLAQLRTFYLPAHLIRPIKLIDLQLDHIGVRAREINRRRERLINEIGVSEATDAQKLLMQNLNIQQTLVQHQKEILINQLNQRILLKFDKCFVLYVYIAGLDALRIAYQTEIMSAFFDVAKQQVDNIQTCFIYKIDGSSIGILFYQETNASFEFYNQFQLAVAVALGIIEVMRAQLAIIQAEDDLEHETALPCLAALAYGSCYGSVLGDQLYTFDIIGQVQNEGLENLKNADLYAVCVNRRLYKQYYREDTRFQAILHEYDGDSSADSTIVADYHFNLDQSYLERVSLRVSCTNYQYVYITAIK